MIPISASSAAVSVHIVLDFRQLFSTLRLALRRLRNVKWPITRTGTTMCILCGRQQTAAPTSIHRSRADCHQHATGCTCRLVKRIISAAPNPCPFKSSLAGPTDHPLPTEARSLQKSAIVVTERRKTHGEICCSPVFLPFPCSCRVTPPPPHGVPGITPRGDPPVPASFKRSRTGQLNQRGSHRLGE